MLVSGAYRNPALVRPPGPADVEITPPPRKTAEETTIDEGVIEATVIIEAVEEAEAVEEVVEAVVIQVVPIEAMVKVGVVDEFFLNPSTRSLSKWFPSKRRLSKLVLWATLN
jgi:hypothetical protein